MQSLLTAGVQCLLAIAPAYMHDDLAADNCGERWRCGARNNPHHYLAPERRGARSTQGPDNCKPIHIFSKKISIAARLEFCDFRIGRLNSEKSLVLEFHALECRILRFCGALDFGIWFMLESRILDFERIANFVLVLKSMHTCRRGWASCRTRCFVWCSGRWDQGGTVLSCMAGSTYAPMRRTLRTPRASTWGLTTVGMPLQRTLNQMLTADQCEPGRFTYLKKCSLCKAVDEPTRGGWSGVRMHKDAVSLSLSLPLPLSLSPSLSLSLWQFPIGNSQLGIPNWV